MPRRRKSQGGDGSMRRVCMKSSRRTFREGGLGSDMEWRSEGRERWIHMAVWRSVLQAVERATAKALR